MGTTANYDLRYPEAGAANNVPSDIKNLADDVDTTVAAQISGVTDSIPQLDSSAGDITTSNPGDPGNAGTSDLAARADHRHAREDAATALEGSADITVSSEVLVTKDPATGTVHLDLAAARQFKARMTGNCTFVFDNIPDTAGRVITWKLRLLQDDTGGRTAGWPLNVVWGTQGAPVLSTAANKSDHLIFETEDGGATIAGFIAGEGY